jgi:hypothetical protein
MDGGGATAPPPSIITVTLNYISKISTIYF